MKKLLLLILIFPELSKAHNFCPQEEANKIKAKQKMIQICTEQREGMNAISRNRKIYEQQQGTIKFGANKKAVSFAKEMAEQALNNIRSETKKKEKLYHECRKATVIFNNLDKKAVKRSPNNLKKLKKRKFE